MHIQTFLLKPDCRVHSERKREPRMERIHSLLNDLVRRLFALLLIFLLAANLSAFISRRIPDKTLLRQAGFTGETAYHYAPSTGTAAYVLLDETAGTASFALVGNSRTMGRQYPMDTAAWWNRWTPVFREVLYGAVIRTEDLRPLRCYQGHYGEAAAEKIYYITWYQPSIRNGIPDVEYLLLGATLEPERLTEQNTLFQRSAGQSTVFAVLAEENRPLASREERMSDYWGNWWEW